jgi:hypothetical protein
MIELFVRLVDHIYIKGSNMGWEEGINTFLKEYLEHMFEKYSIKDWKAEKFLNYHCDKVSENYSLLIKELF